MGLVTLTGIILFGYVFKIGILETPWIMVFRITGALLIVTGIFIWFIGAVRSDMDDHMWIAFAGITFMWHNIWMLVLPVINWIIMSITLINSEEKWLLDLYGAEYETYKTKVNRCIPWKPCEDRIYVTEISNVRWMAYDIPGNVGWIIYIVCLARCFVVKSDFISSRGLFVIMIIAVIPAIFMMIGIAELVSERIAKLDRKLPKVRLLRGFFLCFIFSELIYKTYR